jgi:hypothetical protein
MMGASSRIDHDHWNAYLERAMREGRDNHYPYARPQPIGANESAESAVPTGVGTGIEKDAETETPANE